jgi:hypothetical protein
MLKLAAFFLRGTNGKIPFLGEFSLVISEFVGPKLDEAFYETTLPLRLPRLK